MREKFLKIAQSSPDEEKPRLTAIIRKNCTWTEVAGLIIQHQGLDSKTPSR